MMMMIIENECLCKFKDSAYVLQPSKCDRVTETLPWTLSKRQILFLSHEVSSCSCESRHFFPQVLASQVPHVLKLAQSEKFMKCCNSSVVTSRNGKKRYVPNVSTTPITARGCKQCLSLSVVQMKGKHCWKPHCPNGVVDTFGHRNKFRIWNTDLWQEMD